MVEDTGSLDKRRVFFAEILWRGAHVSPAHQIEKCAFFLQVSVSFCCRLFLRCILCSVGLGFENGCGNEKFSELHRESS